MSAVLSDEPLQPTVLVDEVMHPGAGGVASFIGTVRDHNEGLPVVLLEYHAYRSMAARELAAIAAEIESEIMDVRVACAHRLGELRVGEIAVVCAASAPHRDAALRACRELIERIKSRVPIWKREHGPDGPCWVGWQDARCAADHHHQD